MHCLSDQLTKTNILDMFLHIPQSSRAISPKKYCSSSFKEHGLKCLDKIYLRTQDIFYSSLLVTGNDTNKNIDEKLNRDVFTSSYLHNVMKCKKHYKQRTLILMFQCVSSVDVIQDTSYNSTRKFHLYLFTNTNLANNDYRYVLWTHTHTQWNLLFFYLHHHHQYLISLI